MGRKQDLRDFYRCLRESLRDPYTSSQDEDELERECRRTSKQADLPMWLMLGSGVVFSVGLALFLWGVVF